MRPCRAVHQLTDGVAQPPSARPPAFGGLLEERLAQPGLWLLMYEQLRERERRRRQRQQLRARDRLPLAARVRSTRARPASSRRPKRAPRSPSPRSVSGRRARCASDHGRLRIRRQRARIGRRGRRRRVGTRRRRGRRLRRHHAHTTRAHSRLKRAGAPAGAPVLGGGCAPPGDVEAIRNDAARQRDCALTPGRQNTAAQRVLNIT